jgi:uncharacterized protein YjbJ (UPF0337 family)
MARGLRSSSAPTLISNGRSVLFMNKNQVKGSWNELKGEIKKKWGAVTDNDLMELEGDLQKTAGAIQRRTGDDQAAIERWLREHSERVNR